MIKAEFTDDSVRSLLKDLQKYGESQRKKTKDNLHKAGVRIESASKKLITADDHVDTGRLRASIHHESSTVNNNFRYSDDEGNSFDGSLGVNIGELEVYVGTNVVYANKIRKINDFLFPPAEKERTQLIRRLRQQLNEA